MELTTAVNVTGEPKVEGFALEVRDTAVEYWFTECE